MGLRRALVASLLVCSCTPFEASSSAPATTLEAGTPDAQPSVDAASSADAGPSCPNGALQLSRGGHVEVPPAPELDAKQKLTVEAWIKPSTSIMTREVHIVSHHDHDDSDGYVLMLFNGLKFRVYGGNGANQQDEAQTPITLGEWHHVAGVYDGSAREIRLYVDGVLKKTDTDVRASIDAYRGPLRIGLASYEDRFDYDGLIDEVRVSHAVRYTQSFAPAFPLPDDEADTLATWHFNEGAGTTASDSRQRLSGTLKKERTGAAIGWTTPECPLPR